ncbi:MAG TPA: protease inhibitor I9 family protein [Pyrinomonadaceae bacterium]|nr:protease inhibitor I9 family protein [Pyrinomonadaceae bacterium]
MNHAIAKGVHALKRVAICYSVLIVFWLLLTATSAYSQQTPPATPPSSPTPKSKFLKKTNAIPNRYIVVLNDDVAPDYLSREVRLKRVTAIAERHAQAHNGKFDYVYETALKGYAIELPTEAAAIAISELPEVKFVEQDAMGSWGVGVYNQVAGQCGAELGLQTARSVLSRSR